jgi:hypothetical protein
MDLKTLRRLMVAEVILLLVQFWLGMSVNLFVTIPTSGPLGFLQYGSGVEVLAHIVNGFLVVLFAAAVLTTSIALKNSLLVKTSLLAVVFVLSALTTGFLFLLGGQDDSFSMAMAMSYISAFAVYFYSMYKIGRLQGVGV